MYGVKALKTVSVILLSGLVIVLSLSLGYMLYYGTDGIFSPSSVEWSLEKEEIVDINGLDSIVIDCKEDDITLRPADGDEIRIVQYSMVGRPRDASKLRIDKAGSRLEIQRDSEWWNSIFSLLNRRSRLEIYIPEAYNKKLTVNTVSGDLDLAGDWTLSELRVKLTSGDISVAGPTFETAHIETVSGDIQAEGVRGPHEILSTSGDIELSSAGGASTLQTVSGDVYGRYAEITADSKINTTSGDIEIELGGKMPNLLAKSTSGDVSFAWNKHELQDGRFQVDERDTEWLLELNSVSGDIDVQRIAGE